MKKVIITLLVLVICLSFCSCGGGLNGNWYPEDGNAAYGFPESMHLFKDGTGNIEGVEIEWFAKNNILEIEAGWLGDYYFDYKLSGNKMILIDSEEQETYVKKN